MIDERITPNFKIGSIAYLEDGSHFTVTYVKVSDCFNTVFYRNDFDDIAYRQEMLLLEMPEALDNAK